MRIVLLLRLAPMVAAAACVSGCGHVPVTTMYKLWSFDAATADPAVLRAAVRYPSVLLARTGGVVFSFSSWVEGDSDHHKHDFTLEETREPVEMIALAHYRRPGETVSAYRLADADIDKVRKLQAEHQAMKRTASRQVHGEMSVKADACRQGALPGGQIMTSTFLKVSSKDGYMPVLEDVDLRAELGEKALAEHLPPCLAK